jgi:CxxC motif-containing protein (DUF1111 family)
MASAPAPAGQAIFQEIGCAACHTPTLPAGNLDVPLYSDLLLHDIGPDLDDGVIQGDAHGRDWRTTPLCGIGQCTRFLHDGRALTLREAIFAHGGEAARAAERFRALSAEQRRTLLTFLTSIA